MRSTCRCCRSFSGGVAAGCCCLSFSSSWRSFPSASALMVAIGAFLVATASATQDIVVDAFRVESLSENEQAAGMASYVAAYRVGMLASTAGALFVVSGFQSFGLGHHAAWSAGYLVMAGFVLTGI